MKIINLKNNNVLCENLKMANSLIKRTVGLLNKTSLNKGEGLFITPCSGIHSCFMKFDFDAVFIDKNNKVKHLIKKMPPWKMSKTFLNIKGVIELPAGTIEETDTEIGDLISFKE